MDSGLPEHVSVHRGLSPVSRIGSKRKAASATRPMFFQYQQQDTVVRLGLPKAAKLRCTNAPEGSLVQGWILDRGISRGLFQLGLSMRGGR